jgi:hypothetical protein
LLRNSTCELASSRIVESGDSLTFERTAPCGY